MQTETRQLDEPAPAADSDVEWLVGQTFDRFVVRKVVGRGGMGLVVEAHDPGLDRQVALKVVLDRHASSSAGQRLLREARAMAKLSHPNVVQVHEVGTVDGQVFIVMELVRGCTLSRWLATRPSRAQILEAFTAAGAALHAAHRAGLVHRDFKPSNVLVDDDGRVRVTDFGIALQLVGGAVDELDEPDEPERDWKRRLADLTRTGAAVGTPRYMAPEQRDGGEVTPQSDQYAFCVALWEALFERHPFVDGDPALGMLSTIASTPSNGTATTSQTRTGVPRPPRRDVPGHVVHALRRGLAPAAADRWPTMQALIGALSPRLPRWPWLLLPVVAVATIATGWALSGAPEPTCKTIGDDRVALIWNAGTRAQVHTSLASTKLPAAAALADRTVASLDRFVESWSQVFADGCTGARASEQAAAASDRRLACLDHRLQSMAGVLAALSAPGELASRAETVVATLAAPEECTNGQLGEDQKPPLWIAPIVDQLHRRLAEADANASAGRIELAAAQLSTLRDDVRRIGWAPLRVRTDLAAGSLAAMRGRPALELLVGAARDATANHMDLVATKAWATALTAGGSQLSKQEVELLAGMARAQAERTGDPLLVATVTISEGRARTRLGTAGAGEALCREALGRVAVDGSRRARAIHSDANACLIESLSRQDRFAEVEPLARGLANQWKASNPVEHPLMSDYLQALATALARRKAYGEARRAYEQCLEIRRKTLGPAHPRTVEAIAGLAELAIDEGDPARGETMLRDAVALIAPTIRSDVELPRDQDPRSVLASLHRDLGDLAAQRSEVDEARGHLEQATELTRQTSGDQSLRYGFMLLGLSQFYGTDRVAEAIAANRKARDIFLAHGDHARAQEAGGVLGALYANNEQWAEALPLLEDTVAKLAPSTAPHNRGVFLFLLARAYEHGPKDHARAAATARTAETALQAAGPPSAGVLERLRAFMHQTGIDRSPRARASGQEDPLKRP